MIRALRAYREDDDDAKFIASDIIKCLRKIDGYTPVGKLLYPKDYMRDFKIHYGSQRDFYFLRTNITKYLPKHIIDVGVNQPFLFVEDGKTEQFKKLG